MSEDIRELHDATFGDTAPSVTECDLEDADWWMVFFGKEAVGFAGMAQARSEEHAGYFCRSGVMPIHRGKHLQLRLIRAREQQARRYGWTVCITDTSNNVQSSNTLIRAGYRLYTPRYLWGFSNTLYWRRVILTTEGIDGS